MMRGDHDGPERFALEWRDMMCGACACSEVWSISSNRPRKDMVRFEHLALRNG